MVFDDGSGRTRDYTNQIELRLLKEQVSRLQTEVWELRSESLKWKFEVEKLGVDPNYLTRLEDKVRRLERDEGTVQERIQIKLKEISELKSESERQRCFVDAFGKDAEKSYFALQSAWNRKQRPRALLGALFGFLGGVIASVVAAYLGIVLPGFPR